MRFLDHRNNDDDISRQTVELLVPYQHYVKYLMLKSLLELRAFSSWLSTRNAPEMLVEFLGVPIDVDENGDPEDFSDDLVLRMKYRRRLEALLKDRRDTTMPMTTALVSNAQRIKERFGLTETEMKILVVAVLTKNDSRLNSALNAIGSLTDQGVFNVLGCLLDTRETQIERSLSQSGRLFRTGLVRLDSSGAYSLALKLDLLPGIKERFLRVTDDSNLLELFSASFAAARPASLALKDFDYLNPLLGYVVDLLRDALQQKSLGVNIFLSGPPGVGKTQMALAIAEAIEAPLYEVAITQRDGGERLDGAERLSAYSATQSILAGQRAVAMIDEADDIFGSGIQFGGRSGVPKAWLNHQLETNPVPAIWISNSSLEFDAAHLRRFALHVKVDIPPAAARARILDAHAAPLKITREWSASFARGSNASPAMIAQAATVTQAVVRSRRRRKGVRKGVTDIFQQVLSNNMSALGQAPLQPITQSTDFYDPSLLCCKGIDPMKLVQGLRGSPNGRLLFFGAPGTGKSALGIHIAEALGRPAIVKSVADIQSPYVGVAEKNIANAFQEAKETGAVPIFDEADSYLSNRADAHRQHEVTLVNEFLMQLEGFREGIVIATTNRLDQLDAAALRRFDLKVEFGWLQREQRRLLFKQRCETLGIYEPGVEDLVNDVDNLAPGDIEAVVRGSRFNPMSSAQDFATRLRAEVSLKPDAKRSGPIGFVH